MPEEIEVETKDLQETIQELHEDHIEAEKERMWIRYIALSTAFLAVFAAIGAMQSGALVNEAMISQIKASDTWNEYQASRLKGHIYEVEVDNLIQTKSQVGLTKKYSGKIEGERSKADTLMPKAKELEKESQHFMHQHHRFAIAVAAIQVAIALGAVAALTRVKPIWAAGLVVGGIGVVAFALGFLK